MPLQAADKAKLILWLCAARTLDDDCCPTDDAPGVALIAAVRSIVHGAAGEADHVVPDADAIQPLLRNVVVRLDAYSRKGVSVAAAEMVSGASSLLRSSMACPRLDSNDDGPALRGTNEASCNCGLLGLVGEIEHGLRQLLSKEAALPYGNGPLLTYSTTLAEPAAAHEFAPFCVDASASIRQSPRQVTILLRKAPITSRDLWHITYTLYHELVCHAFQGASAAAPLPDAPANCHWSEGWMDALAFELVDDLTKTPPPWLPISGETARGALRELHEHRYAQPKSMNRDDILRRRQARDAYKKLAELLENYNLVRSAKEAQEVARRFSLMANSHSQAHWRRLKTLSTTLRQLLVNSVRPTAALAAAHACLGFTRHGSLAELEKAIRLI